MFLRKQLISCQIRAQIRLLLKRSSDHSISAASLSPSLPHRVLVRDSTIPGAGQGVFSQHSAKPGTVLCLYPGVHTPALPTTVDDDSFLYLANQITPSGSPPCENAHILNLHSIGGGYLDGAALRVGNRILDANPNACAHFVNHSVKRANVNVLSFAWSNVLTPHFKASLDKQSLYQIPNEVRSDNSPWYYDAGTNEVVLLDGRVGSNFGAAVRATKPIAVHEELFLDYGVIAPLPAWAKPWYDAMD
jgi:hypothetical protein